MVEFVCSWCGSLTSDSDVGDVDSGTVLTCSESGCEGDTVVDLRTPAERSRAFALAAKAAVDAQSIQAQLKEWASLLKPSDSILINRNVPVVFHLGSIVRRGFPRVAAFIHNRLAEA